VLVAEDDENLGEVLARGLREHGYVVDLVPDGETAANYLRFYSYEVLVLDWRMPRLSGLDVVQKLRQAGAGIPVDRRSIAQHVWDNEADAFGSNTIDVHLARLRAKLAGAGVRIETVRGVGYRIIPL
jgi:DNA-binding response OmpR family regulator